MKGVYNYWKSGTWSSNEKRKHYAEFLCILTSLINSVTALQANEIILF